MYSRDRSLSQSGQIGLVVLLISAVLVTVGLGVASQSVLETKTTTQETTSSQTFNAAEQSIEDILTQNLNEYTPTSTMINGNTVSPTLARQQNSYTNDVLVGHSVQLNMKGTNPSDKVTSIENIAWPDIGKCQAIVITVIQSSTSNYSLTRKAYKNSSCDTVDDFSSFTCSGGACALSLGAALPLRADPQLVRIKAVYNDIRQLQVTLVGNGTLPSQGYTITSTAVNQTSGETRAVQVNKSVAAVPSIFDYVLFAGQGDISQ